MTFMDFTKLFPTFLVAFFFGSEAGQIVEAQPNPLLSPQLIAAIISAVCVVVITLCKYFLFEKQNIEDSKVSARLLEIEKERINELKTQLAQEQAKNLK
jgi:predicted membrane metal-binding protein